MTKETNDGGSKTSAPKEDSRTIQPNGDLIRNKRKALGSNMAEFAHKAGICLTTLSRAEHNRRVFTSTLKIIADTLGVDMKELIHPDDPSAHC